MVDIYFFLPGKYLLLLLLQDFSRQTQALRAVQELLLQTQALRAVQELLHQLQARDVHYFLPRQLHRG